MPGRSTKRRQFLAATGAGALAFLGRASAQAADWTDAEKASVSEPLLMMVDHPAKLAMRRDIEAPSSSPNTARGPASWRSTR